MPNCTCAHGPIFLFRCSVWSGVADAQGCPEGVRSAPVEPVDEAALGVCWGLFPGIGLFWGGVLGTAFSRRLLAEWGSGPVTWVEVVPGRDFD